MPPTSPALVSDRDTNLIAGAPPQPGDKVLYRLHGGRLSAHPADPTANIAWGILAHSPRVRVALTFAIEFRLSSAAPYNEANAFPAALLDALARCVYHVERIGFHPEDVIVQGDCRWFTPSLTLGGLGVRRMKDHWVPSQAHSRWIT